MWNIRSHARRFPVHTGTLTPSIAHPNRFLNHLKRFSAGFLTFRGGKTEKRTLWGENSPVCCADSPLWDGALGIAGKFAGKSQSQPYRKGRQPSPASRSDDGEGSRRLMDEQQSINKKIANQIPDDGEGSRREKLPSHLALLDARLPLLSPSVTSSPGAGEVVLGDGVLDMAGKLPDKLQSFRHARGSLSEGAGKTVRF